MARVTVEDCLDKVENRFQLVLVATKRARQLANGVMPLVDWENDKPTIVALREIADGLIDASILDEPLYPVMAEEETAEEGAEGKTEVAADAEAETQAQAAPAEEQDAPSVDAEPEEVPAKDAEPEEAPAKDAD